MVQITETRTQLVQPWIEIGRHTYGLPRIIGGGPAAHLSIGAFCSIAGDVEIELAGDHHLDRGSTYPFDNVDGWGSRQALKIYRRPLEVHIGNDVWLGHGCKILHGVTIGDGAAVGAWATVSKDVRPYAVVVGNPAVEVSRRFSDEWVDRLLELKWWDWPEEKIREHIDLIKSLDVEALCSIL